MGVKFWTFVLREGHSLRVFENSMLRVIPGQKTGENYIIVSSIIYILHQKIIRMIK
jgi:hypothetical protein